MKALLGGLLAYLQVNSQGKPLAPVDSGRILDRALARVAENGATVTRGDLPQVVADAAQLGQLFQHLVGNGVKFRSQLPPEIHVSARRGDGEWIFAVRDNGIGIEPQYRERIFQVFQRLHTRQEYDGTGIGLAVCRKIVERHGGRIWVDSEPGSGSTFCFTIPDHRPEL